jgi:anthranilate synthase component 2
LRDYHTPEDPLVLIIDNYDSFTYNLVHLVAQHTVDYQVHRNDALSLSEACALNPQHILISPGPGRPEQAGISEALIRECGPRIPILGVCLGHQAIGQVFGGRVTYAPSLMHGKTSLIQHDAKGVFVGVPQDFVATRYHSLVIDEQGFPDSLDITARTPEGVIMGVRHKHFPIEGIQFHPESILTVEGPKLIFNWLTR